MYDVYRAYITIHDDIEAIINSVKTLPSNRELSLVITKLEESNMWLEKEMYIYAKRNKVKETDNDAS